MRVTVNSVVVGPTWAEGVEECIAGIAEKSGEQQSQVLQTPTCMHAVLQSSECVVNL